MSGFLTGFFEIAYQLGHRVNIGKTMEIALGAYHFGFFAVLNLVAKRFENDDQTVLWTYVSNYVNAVVFAVIFFCNYC